MTLVFTVGAVCCGVAPTAAPLLFTLTLVVALIVGAWGLSQERGSSDVGQPISPAQHETAIR